MFEGTREGTRFTWYGEWSLDVWLGGIVEVWLSGLGPRADA